MIDRIGESPMFVDEGLVVEDKLKVSPR